jgi:formylglycine-generating enzyme required for sulfatase activity
MEVAVRAFAPIVTVSALIVAHMSEVERRITAGLCTWDGVRAPDPEPARSDQQPCPPGTVHVESFCIDRYEAPNVEGARPFVMKSALDAESWCKSAGRRLCTEQEWERACSGPKKLRYPYGTRHEPGRCNDGALWKIVDEPALNTFPSPRADAEAERLWQGETSGARDGCASEEGVMDLTGNVEEWVRRGRGHVLKGCYWASCYGGSKPSCTWTNAAHGLTFRFYETGFRCCTEASVRR